MTWLYIQLRSNIHRRVMMADQYTGVMGEHPQSITIHRYCILNRQILVLKSTKKPLEHCHTSHKLPGTSERSFLIAISGKDVGERAIITSFSINVTIKFGLHKNVGMSVAYRRMPNTYYTCKQRYTIK